MGMSLVGTSPAVMDGSQVTSDGVPVIWHDDSILQQQHAIDSAGQNDEIVVNEIKDMTIEAFRTVVSAGCGNQERQLVRKFRGAASREELPGGELPW